MLCPNCGTENPEQAKFCFECASPLTAPTSDPGTERKVVSVLFCDLVGFTSRSESADPEDVLATVRPYHALLRTEIEGYGGTVEKFIGDAVMAVFGAPVAHEDDAERAVRAGLRILETLQDLNEAEGLDLSVRIGINTGEAVVALGARPEQGEGMVTGDVVNTAARIQTGAPVGGIAVGQTTYRSTKDIFEYEPLEPIAAKGKTEPVPAWRALAARARFGTDLTRTHTTPLVGRDVEDTLLRSLYERAVRDRSCQLVTILGEPGVGKSRMVAELSDFIEELPDLIRWRQGRCLPYGDGITFWALGEIVKAQAGILESDSLEEAGDKLEIALRAAGPFEPGEHEWLKARLAPLVGAEATGSAEQEESFTAWRRFLEAMPGSDPAVYVFEDLHWADRAMLAFIEHLADWSEGVPMLLVGTARPELSEKHPNWGAGLRNATTMNLAPLSEEETATLIGELLGQAVLPAEVQTPILERAGGNPLYAEEFIRMLKDRGLLVQHGRTWELAEAADIPFPEGVHGLIAARLDTLSAERKALLQDAAVIGKVFWSGALAEMGGRDETAVRDALHELTRKEFVRAARQPSMEGEHEYGFWHMLVRDVVYSQIPRAARASKHVAAAEWIEARAGERVEDLADVLAYHYAEALDLTEASGGELAGLTERALRFLALAAERAANLDPARAESTFERALALAPAGHPERPGILYGLAGVMHNLNRFAQAGELAEEAISGYLAAADTLGAAEAKILLFQIQGSLGASSGELVELLDEVIAELETLPPGRELVHAYASRAGLDYVADRDAEAIALADRALSVAERLELPPDLKALRVRGSARWFTGRPEGLEDIERSIALARERGQVRDAAWGYNELSNVLAVSRGPGEALGELDEGVQLALRSGHPVIAMDLQTMSRQELLYDLGRWEELLGEATAFLSPTERMWAPKRRSPAGSWSATSRSGGTTWHERRMLLMVSARLSMSSASHSGWSGGSMSSRTSRSRKSISGRRERSSDRWSRLRTSGARGTTPPTCPSS
jgi:class 3 adenylate cyclase/tetratricopeptide (TPR) repeat protein